MNLIRFPPPHHSYAESALFQGRRYFLVLVRAFSSNLNHCPWRECDRASSREKFLLARESIYMGPTPSGSYAEGALFQGRWYFLVLVRAFLPNLHHYPEYAVAHQATINFR